MTEPKKILEQAATSLMGGKSHDIIREFQGRHNAFHGLLTCEDRQLIASDLFRRLILEDEWNKERAERVYFAMMALVP